MKMGRKSLIFLTVLLITAVIVIVLYPTEKKRIKKTLSACKEAVINEDIDRLMKSISFNYNDDYGGSYLHSKKRMELIFDRYDDFDIRLDIMKLTVDGKQAEAETRLSVIATEGNNRGYLAGDAGSARNITVYLEKSPFSWKVLRIEDVVENR